MNRRDFNIRLLSLSAAPLAPALPAAAARAAPLSGKAAMHYPWAARYARVHDACSPERLTRAFRLAPEVAREIFAKLQADGVISAPGLTGLARATAPINWDIQFSPPPAQAMREALSRRLKTALNDQSSPDETGAPASDDPALTEARKTESEPTPEAPPTGSAESPRA